MKKYLIGAAILAATASVPAQDLASSIQRRTSDRVVGYDQVLAVVEDTTITNEDLMQAMAPLIQKIRDDSRNQTEYNRHFEQLSRAMLQELVDKVIIVKHFHDQGYMIPQSVLDANFDDDIKKNFNGDRSEFIKYLQSQNKTIKKYRKEQEENFIVMQMRYMQRKSASEISPAKITEYYNENKQKWYSPERVKFRQITLKDDSPEALKAKAEKIAAEVRAGLDFAEAAKKYSQDDFAKDGGEAGTWYSKGQLTPEVEKALFSLKPGETSDPLVISNYAFIWKLEDKKPEGVQPLDDVREMIENTIINENANAEYDKWLDRIRKKAYIRFY